MSTTSPNSHSPSDEISELVDRIYDGTIDAAGWSRIEALFRQDRRNVQTYVERFDFHCELTEQSDHRPVEITAMDMLERTSQIAFRRENRKQFRVGLGLVACGFLVAVTFGWFYFATVLNRPSVGMVAGLSMDLKLGSHPLELGQVIRDHQTISVRSGIVSLQLQGTLVDLVGPVSARVDSAGKLTLRHGRIVSRVSPQGIGFTVKTPDAEIVDLGTEFLVEYSSQDGTYVGVRRGAAQARQLDWKNEPVKIMDLTASRAARFLKADGTFKEVAYRPEPFREIDESRRGIRNLTGAIRTLSQPPASVASDALTTPNHFLVIPEKVITLESDLTIESLQGPVTIPAGTTVESYLVHYDPTLNIKTAPRGAMTFWGKVAAVVGSSKELNQTDSLFGLTDMTYERRTFRELELDEDEIRLSDDRQTISFFFGLTPPEYLDEARILVIPSDF